MKKILIVSLFIIFLTSGIFALEACSDSNEIDTSEVPCMGLTNVVDCTGKVTITNVNTSVQINVTNKYLWGWKIKFYS